MKLRYLFMSALVCGAFAACSQDEVIDNGGQKPVDENGNSYIALRLVTAGNAGTRAGADTEGDGSEFDEGVAPENAVKEARFYYFKADGSAYYSGTAAGGGTTTTHNFWDTTVTPDTEDDTDNNIETICEVVLVVNGEQEAGMPYSIATIINPDKTQLGDDPLSLTELKAKIADHQTGKMEAGKFVMSTSVYDGGVALHDHAATIVDGAWKTTADAAKAAPTDIYVERVLAKVRWAAPVDKVFDLKNEDSGALSFTGETTCTGGVNGNTKTYTLVARFEGMGLAHESEDSYLMKAINAGWDLGFNWKDAANFRSYWATGTEDQDINQWSWNDIKANTGNRAYCQEDTKLETDAEEDTEAVFAATLGYEDGGTFKALEIARWNFINFISEEGDATSAEQMMLDYIAHSFYFDGMTTDAAGNTPVAATDLKFVENTEAGKIHEVKVALAEGKTLYKDDAEVTEFPAIPNALLYKNGMTYYYTPVQHKAGFTVTDASKTGAEYGIVRNHFYNITVNSVTGLGTPVYNPDTEIPTEEVSVEAGYLAVKINVLSWRVVNQGVDL